MKKNKAFGECEDNQIYNSCLIVLNPLDKVFLFVKTLYAWSRNFIQ